ncbi:cytochrome P450 6k1-like [Rhodnius prolixus]|uniref:cytochrome P450 6k1-like n=1 Tax=Rhodnius prolixus TaxID=13249 RepID=UPI003D187C32
MLFTLVIIALALLFILDYNKRQYWTRKGVLQTPSLPLVGHFLPLVTQQNTPNGVYDKIYQITKKNSQPYIGIYEFWRPTLIIKDLSLVEKILIKDFSSFLDHPRWVFDKKSMLHDSLFNMTGDRWRAMRYQMIPWFTTGRMRSLFPHLINCITIPDGEFEAMNVFRIIAADTIATFLGVKIDDKKEFQDMNKDLHDVSIMRYYRLLLVEHFENFAESLGLAFLDSSTENYFINFTKTVLLNKDHSLVQRLQKLLVGRKVCMRKNDLYKKSADNEIYTYEVTEELIENVVAQLLLGGLDVTSNTMTWFLIDLALHPDVQKKARDEIRNVLKTHGGWSYESVQEMKYVANCLKESMRRNATFPFIFRLCTSNYKTPDGIKIEKGTKIIIPATSNQMNPSFYSEPELYKPERFGQEQKQTDLLWLPFGEGPRKCTGIRFSQMVMKTALGRMLENHEIILSEKTKKPIVVNPRAFLGRPKTEIIVKLKKVQ